MRNTLWPVGSQANIDNAVEPHGCLQPAGCNFPGFESSEPNLLQQNSKHSLLQHLLCLYVLSSLQLLRPVWYDCDNSSLHTSDKQSVASLLRDINCAARMTLACCGVVTWGMSDWQTFQAFVAVQQGCLSANNKVTNFGDCLD